MENQYFVITPDLLATKGQRFTNYILDLILQYGVFYGVTYLFFYIGEFTEDFSLLEYWNNLSTVADYLFNYSYVVCYFFIMESITYKTLGKYVSKTMVIMRDGTKPTLYTIFIRTLCRIIPFDALSFLRTNGEGWHDAISKTYVVDVQKYEAKRNACDNIDQIGVFLEE